MPQSVPRGAARQSNFELLRIVAMFCVVVYHAACALETAIPAGEMSFDHFFLQLCRCAGDLGNSLFVLISGYFLVRSAFSLRRVLRLWAQTWLYSLLLGALALAAGWPASLNGLWHVAAPVLSLSYWFITCYLIFCFFAPCLNRLFAALERRAFKRLLLVMFVCFSLLRTLAPGGFVSFTKFAMFFFLYSLAAYVRLYPDAVGAFDRPWRCFAAAAALTALLLGYFALCFRFGERFSFLRPDRFEHMATLPLLGLSLALFLGFRSLRMPRLRLVNVVAGSAFGVYLIHYSYAWREKLWELLFGALPAGSARIPSLLLAALLVYAACTLLDLACRKVAEPLYMRCIDRCIARLPAVKRWARAALPACLSGRDDAAARESALSRAAGTGKEGQAPRSGRRKSNMELLRVLAMFMVVTYHVSNRVGAALAPEGFDRVFFLATALLGDLGNSVFLLISGYFMVESGFRLRRVLRLWAEVFFYSVLFAVVFALAGGETPGLRTWARVFFPLLSNDYWFATHYVIFSFFMPFLNRLLHALDRRGLQRLLLTMFVPFSLLRTVLPGGFIGFANLSMFAFYYCLAAYVRLYPQCLRALSTPRRCFGAAAVVLALHVGYLCLCCLLGERVSLLTPGRFARMYAVPQVALAFAFFLGFARLRPRCSRFVNAVASAVFGVYLVHYNLFVRDWLEQTIRALLGGGAVPVPPLVALGMALLVYTAATLIDLLRRKAVEPLYMRCIDRLPPVRRELSQAARR